MTCAEFQNRLSAYLDGELSHWKRWKVHNHLRQCGECGELIRALEGVDQCVLSAVQDTVEHGPSREYLTTAVMRRLPAMPPASFRPRPTARAWAAGMVVAGLQLVALGGAYWWGFSHGVHQPGGSSSSSVLGTAGGLLRGGNGPLAGHGPSFPESPVRTNGQSNGPVPIAPFANTRFDSDGFSSFSQNGQQSRQQSQAARQRKVVPPSKPQLRIHPGVLQPSGG